MDQHKDKIVPLMLKRAMRQQGISVADQPRLENRLAEVLARLQALLGKQAYLVGEQISLADLTLAAHLNSIDMLPFVGNNPEYQWLFEYRERIRSQVLGST